MDTSVKYFDSTMLGAPALSGTAGTLLSVIDACLVNGFGTVTVDSLTVASGIATVVTTSSHGFSMVGDSGHVVYIAGASEADLNGEKRIASVPSATSFTYEVPDAANGVATGTMVVRRASAGWEKRYSETNKAVYARTDVAATLSVLCVDDTSAQWPLLLMYETMSDINTGVGASLSRYLCRSSLASTLARAWRLYADTKSFYMFVKSSGEQRSSCAFGDLRPLKSADAYHSFITGHINNTDPNNGAALYGLAASDVDIRLARSYTQLGGSIGCYRKTVSGQTSWMGRNGGIAGYPSPVDNSFHAAPVQVWESGNHFRGYLPGVFSSLHDGAPGDGTIIRGVTIGASANHTMFQQTIIAATNNFNCTMDITGPWQ
jgi:hypothetical protein